MRTRIIPDIHGQPFWKRLVSPDVDRYILLGDYFDSFTVSPKDQIKNVREMFEVFTEKNSIWLFGNHDFSYLTSQYLCGGYSEKTQKLFETIRKQFEARISHLVYKEDNFVFSHAGVSKKWLAFWANHSKYSIFEDQRDTPFWNLDENEWKLVAMAGWSSGGAMGQPASPIWSRPNEYPVNPFEGCVQFCGHTPQEKAQQLGDYYYLDCGEGKPIRIGEKIVNIAKPFSGIDIIDGQIEWWLF